MCAPALDSFSRGAFRLFVPLPRLIFSVLFPTLCLWLHPFPFAPPSLLSVTGFVSLASRLLLCQCDRGRYKAAPVGIEGDTADARGHTDSGGWKRDPLPLHASASGVGNLGGCVCVEAPVNSSLNSK